MSNIANCPICEKEADLSASNQYRPFCCKRCRLIDLGQWINGSYAISETTIENDFDPDSTQKH